MPRPRAATGGEPERRFSVLHRLLLVALGVAVSLLVCELGLRFARPFSPRLRALLYVPTVSTEFDGASTTAELLARSPFGHHPLGRTRGFVLSSRGFRTHEYAPAKEAGVVRVVALGDSFTFDSSSVPYDQMWHQVFGRRLAAWRGAPVETLNLGVPAVGPRFELRLWELEGERLAPDLVALGFFVGNDFTDEAGTPLGEGSYAAPARWSLTWRLARNAVRSAGLAAPGDDPAAALPAAQGGGREEPGYAATYDGSVPSLPEDQYLRIEGQRLEAIAGPDGERFARLCDDASRVVERLARSVEATGAALVVLVIPDEVQVDDEVRRRVARPDRVYDLDRAQRCLAARFAERHVAYFDALPLLRERTGPFYRPLDTHWNSAGNRLAGEALADFVAADRRMALP